MTSDFLLGIPEEKKEQEAKKLFTELVEATYAKEADTEKVIRLIREIRLNHLKSRRFHNFWLSAKGSVYRLPEKAMAVASPIKLGCSSPWLKDIIWTAEENEKATLQQSTFQT